MNRSEIAIKVSRARGDAYREAKPHFRCLFSRGTFLATADKDGQCRPCTEAEALHWNGSLKEIKTVIAKVEKDYPAVTRVYIAGGYDGADSPRARESGDYDP